MSFQTVTVFFTHIPTDWIILFALAVFIAFDTLRSGASRAIALALALPLTLVVATNLSDTAILGGVLGAKASPAVQAMAISLVFAVSFYVMLRISRRFSDNSSYPLQALVAGVAAAAALVVFWIQIPSLESVWKFGPQVQHIFGATFRVWWLLGAYAALAFIRR